MAETPHITDDEIIAGWRAAKDDNGGPLRVVKRKRLRPPAGLSGSYFERVEVRCGDQKVEGILKLGHMPYGPPTRERLFFAELADRVSVRVPHCLAVGAPRDSRDNWVLMERLPKSKWLADWTEDETLDALRRLAALHAPFLGDPPPSLPRPFTRDLDYSLGFVPEGVRALCARYDELPYLPRVAGDRALDLLLELAARPDAFRAALARSPETLLHGDYHRGNMLLRDGEAPVHFDWQFVCAGPPAYDLAIFWLYLGAVNKRGLFFDRGVVRERSLTWQQVVDTYVSALAELRPDVDLDAITSCADAAIMCEAIRQITYFGHSMGTYIGLMRFLYRDHRTIGGRIARWLGLDQAWLVFSEVFTEFERRAPRFLVSAPARPG